MATVSSSNETSRHHDVGVSSQANAELRRSRLFGITLMLVLAAILGLIIALS